MSDPFDFADHPHRRRNPLTEEWVLVSPHRNKRPWQGQSERAATKAQPSYDGGCYLCPNNQRMGGSHNPDYSSTFCFDNDFPALNANPVQHNQTDALFASHAEHGRCRVVAYSPDHSKTLAELEHTAIQAVVQTWIGESNSLGQQFAWVQIFENKGEVMGCSMPHPHGQIWAQEHAPTLLAKETLTQADYFAAHKTPLLLDYASREREQDTRVVAANPDWVALVPFWAAWPFEMLLLPLFPVRRVTELTISQQHSLATILRQLLVRYDNLFDCAFPYSMGWHGAPYNQDDDEAWQLHAHFYPPLLRSQAIRKFMVGYEMLAEPQRDITPEQAADILRQLPDLHYKQRQQAGS